jgi:hypothetical protein
MLVLQQKEWRIPPNTTPSSSIPWKACWMVYQRPVDPRFPVVCFDETPVQLVSETRKPLPMLIGQPERYDYEYNHEGTADLSLFFAPLQMRQQNRFMKRLRYLTIYKQ